MELERLAYAIRRIRASPKYLFCIGMRHFLSAREIPAESANLPPRSRVIHVSVRMELIIIPLGPPGQALANAPNRAAPAATAAVTWPTPDPGPRRLACARETAASFMLEAAVSP